MIATQAVMATAGSARQDGSIVNQVLKIAIIFLIAIFVIGLAIWAYILISNWSNIKQFLQVLYTFLGGGILGFFNPFSKAFLGRNPVGPEKIGLVETQATSGSFIQKSIYWFTSGFFGKA